MAEDGLFLTIQEAAKKLNCNPETIRRRIKRGQIRAQMTAGPKGDQYLIPSSELTIQDAELVRQPQLPATVIAQIADAVRADNLQAIQVVVEAANEPLYRQISAQQELITAQADELRKLREHQSQQNVYLLKAINDLTEQQKKAAAAASAREAQPWWQRLFGG